MVAVMESPNDAQTAAFPEAVLFDLDGTLIDYEGASIEALKEALQHEYPYTLEIHAKIVGTKSSYWSRFILRELNVPEEKLSPEEFEKRYFESMEKRYASLPQMKGAWQLVHFLHARGIKVAIATSSPKESFDTKILAHPKILERVHKVVTGNEVSNGKPAPDIFLEAAKRLGVEPQNCVVVEDSPHGVAAAVAGGMRVAAIPNPSFPGDFSKATVVITELADILEHFWTSEHKMIHLENRTL
eukprot:GEMP01051656.1.p1 GENE.GEMP01051656.1~~GEMP01051656.1.p1  ORF type:complete len:264 (+),score=52.05 GEMP01051656.1:66-794(+)